MEWVLVRKEDIEDSLRNNPSEGSKMLEPFNAFKKEHNLPFGIIEDSNVTDLARVHKNKGELWHCLEGDPVFICGGSLSNPSFEKDSFGNDIENELISDLIREGEEVFLKAGDWIWIPAGVVHQRKCERTVRLIVIEIPC